MSKGLSKQQRAIVGLLDGTLPHKVYSPSEAMTTSELLEELECRGFVRQGTPRKIAMHTVRRACISLSDRGILEGEYVNAEPCSWANVLSWRVVKRQGHGEARDADGDAPA